MDWDAAYDNRAAVDGVDNILQTWLDDARAFRQSYPFEITLNRPYGSHARQKLDIFMPERTPKGVLFFVHGGYWRGLDRTYSSHFTKFATDLGYISVLPSYPLSPETAISEITASIQTAFLQTAAQFDGPIRIVGHSVGGHLATRMICESMGLPDDIRARIQSVTSISGVHDLLPLLKTEMNQGFGLDPVTATRESPALQTSYDIPVNVWVGAHELPEFIRQSETLVKAWPLANLFLEEGADHFTVLEPLKNPHSKMVKSILAGV